MGATVVTLAAPDDLEAVFAGLRRVLRCDAEPDAVRWVDGQRGQPELFDPGAAQAEAEDGGDDRDAASTAPLRLPREFLDLLRSALLHESPDRFHAAHTLARAILRDRRAWGDTLGAERLRLERMAREVRREIHKMHAFVRFRPLADEDGRTHVAWFEPAHHVVRAAAPYFLDRFAAMRWAILTPRLSLHWDRRQLAVGPPAVRADAPKADDGEALWLAYYRSIFNPARLKPAAMHREMPMRFWRNLPEAAQIGAMMRGAHERAYRMQTSADAVRVRRAGRAGPASCGGGAGRQAGEALAASPRQQLRSLARHASACDACAFAADATQTVWGEGPVGASLMLVGEQPGDREDLAGRPFVGPAGQLLRRAIAALRWPVHELYLTNAVKHFKYEWRGRRRVHETATRAEAEACTHWLEEEIAAVGPRAIVALGRTAATSLMGAPVSIEARAGHWLRRAGDGLAVYVMPHPAAVLRVGGPDAARREADWTALLAGAGEALPKADPRDMQAADAGSDPLEQGVA